MFGIQRNKNAAGRIGNMTFGLVGFADGFIRVASFGFLHTSWPLSVARLQAKMSIKNIAKGR